MLSMLFPCFCSLIFFIPCFPCFFHAHLFYQKFVYHAFHAFTLLLFYDFISYHAFSMLLFFNFFHTMLSMLFPCFYKIKKHGKSMESKETMVSMVSSMLSLPGHIHQRPLTIAFHTSWRSGSSFLTTFNLSAYFT